MALTKSTKPDTLGITHRGQILDKVIGDVTQYNLSSYTGLADMFAAILADKRDNVDVVFDGQVIVSDRDKRASLKLSGINSFRATGIDLVDKTEYTSVWDIWRLFDLSNINYVEVSGSFKSTLSFVGGDKQGLQPIRATGVGVLVFTGLTDKCYFGVQSEDTKNVTVRTVNTDTRYPLHFTKCGVIDVVADNNGCRRDFFLIDGCKSARMDISAVDTQQGSPIKHYFQPNRMSHETLNVDIKYTYRSTGRYTLPDRVAPIWLDWGWDSKNTESVGSGVMRNIRIEYDVAGGTWGSVIGTSKLIDESVNDPEPRGYVMQNVTVTGRIELGGGWRGNGYVFNFHTEDNWKQGDVVNGVKLKDLIIRKRNGGDVILNTNQLEAAISGSAGVILDNVSSPELVLSGSAQYGDKVRFSNVTMKEYTSKDAVINSVATLRKTKVINITAGSPVTIKLGKVDNYRTMSMFKLSILATTPQSGVGSAFCGEMAWLLPFATTPSALAGEGKVIPVFTKGTAMTPTISADADGNVVFKATGWEGLDFSLQLDTTLTYNKWGGGTNTLMQGMVSSKFTLE